MAIADVLEYLDKDDLHFIPSILSEVVISAKEVNEKARTAAFDLLVAMGEKMKQGGTVVQSKVPHLPDDAPSVPATLEEYFTMVAAGLAGSTPHMISASITALTRILYQFKDEVSAEMVTEMVSTMDLFLTSKNREMVQSVLGFVKVSVISLPRELMIPRLESLIKNLMIWSHEHKAHFKAKVKHIMERMIRRFGYDIVEKYMPEEDKKLIINIRKTRDRRKKNKEAGEGDEEEEEQRPTSVCFPHMISVSFTNNRSRRNRGMLLPTKRLSTAVRVRTPDPTLRCTTTKARNKRRARRVPSTLSRTRMMTHSICWTARLLVPFLARGQCRLGKLV